VEDKVELMRKLGKKQLTLYLQTPLQQVPSELSAYALALSGDGHELTYTYDTQGQGGGIVEFMQRLGAAGIPYKDLQTTQSSLEDIFVSLVRSDR
jgi:ABC-2 type transport system ATP-binding protein